MMTILSIKLMLQNSSLNSVEKSFDEIPFDETIEDSSQELSLESLSEISGGWWYYAARFFGYGGY